MSTVLFVFDSVSGISCELRSQCNSKSHSHSWFHFRMWNLSLSLKYTEDGHVVTVESTQGHSLSLRISGGSAVLSLSSPEGSESNATSGPLQANIFTRMVSA